MGGGLGSITRLEHQRVVTVPGEAAPRASTAQALLGQVQQYLADYEQALPPGYTLEYTGESEDQAESFGFLTTALLIGIALIFVILIAQFNSVTNPLIIMVADGPVADRGDAGADPDPDAVRADDVHRRDLAGGHRREQRASC